MMRGRLDMLLSWEIAPIQRLLQEAVPFFESRAAECGGREADRVTLDGTLGDA